MMKYEGITAVSGIILIILLSGCIRISDESESGSLTGLYILTSNLLCLILLITPAVTALLMVYGGFSYLSSADDPTKRAEAKNMVFNAILGLIIVFGIAFTAQWLLPGINLGACLGSTTTTTTVTSTTTTATSTITTTTTGSTTTSTTGTTTSTTTTTITTT